MRDDPEDRKLKPRGNYASCFFAHKFPPVTPADRGSIDWEICLVREAVEEFLKGWSMRVFQTDQPGEWLSETVMEGILETPFGLYETISGRPNVALEAGFALAKGKPVILIVGTVAGKPDPEPPSDLGALVQVRYERKNSQSLLSALNEKVPIRYLSPYWRLRNLLETATRLQRALLAFVLEYPSQQAHRIAGEMQGLGYPCSNPELMQFFSAFDEFLEFEGSPNRPTFLDLRAPQVIADYRAALRKEPELRDQLILVKRLGRRA